MRNACDICGGRIVALPLYGDECEVCHTTYQDCDGELLIVSDDQIEVLKEHWLPTIARTTLVTPLGREELAIALAAASSTVYVFPNDGCGYYLESIED
jgi:hypothetical protein